MTLLSETIGGNVDDVVQTPSVVAQRTLCIFAMTALAFGAEKSDIEQWLDAENLLNSLTPRESQFLLDFPNVSEKTIIEMTWQVEALVVLIWALQLVDSLPPKTQQVDTAILTSLLPPFSDVSVSEFITHARLRNEQELFKMAVYLQDQHGRARTQHSIEIIEVLQERHRAINWIVGYCQQSWEDCNTDT